MPSSSPVYAIIRYHVMGFTSLRYSLQMGVYTIHFPLDKNPLSDYTLIKIRKQILKAQRMVQEVLTIPSD